MSVFADTSIPCNHRKTMVDGFVMVDYVSPCPDKFRILHGNKVMEMTDEEKATYYPPEPIPEPTPKEKRASAYEQECDPILVQIYGYELEKEITKSTAKDATIAELKTLWKSTRDAIRARYPDEG